jgi:DNA-binding transcriptional regulator YiaG
MINDDQREPGARSAACIGDAPAEASDVAETARLAEDAPALPYAAAIDRLVAERHERRHAVPPLDPSRPHGVPWAGQVIEATRRRLGLTQKEFALAIGVPLTTLRCWERDRAVPAPSARALLTMLHQNPHDALRMLAGDAAAKIGEHGGEPAAVNRTKSQ